MVKWMNYVVFYIICISLTVTSTALTLTSPSSLFAAGAPILSIKYSISFWQLMISGLAANDIRLNYHCIGTQRLPEEIMLRILTLVKQKLMESHGIYDVCVHFCSNNPSPCLVLASSHSPVLSLTIKSVPHRLGNTFTPLQFSIVRCLSLIINLTMVSSFNKAGDFSEFHTL